MNKIGRNSQCPCGSGKKYKRCHGQKSASVQGTPSPARPSPAWVAQMIAREEAKRIQQQKQQGKGKPIISAEFKGYRFVADGMRLHYSNKWKTFHDFLADYLKQVLGKEWWFSEIGKAREQMHPILLWAHLMYEQQLAVPTVPGKINSVDVTGAISAYMTLAYDLYCLSHNVELQEKLVERLKHHDQFWGARYEVFAAAVMIRAGFMVEFENEDDRSSSHCEFTATNPKTGRKFSVEAKHRESVRSRVGRRLFGALQKEAKYERIVFIDVNTPSDSAVDQAAMAPLLSAIRGVRPFEKKIFDKKLLPPAYLVITNSPQHHHLTSVKFRPGAVLEGFRIPDLKFDAIDRTLRDAIESKERHRDLYDLRDALMAQTQVPSTFDGEIPEFAFGAATQRLMIGNLYEIPCNGSNRIGRLTSATVNESEGVAYCAYHFEDTDEATVFTTPMTAEELSAWRKHPDTFFGVPDKGNQRVHDPVELYEFFLKSYSKTDRLRLLELMADAPDLEALQELTQPELAKEYCIRLASSSLINWSASQSQAADGKGSVNPVDGDPPRRQ